MQAASTHNIITHGLGIRLGVTIRYPIQAQADSSTIHIPGMPAVVQ